MTNVELSLVERREMMTSTHAALIEKLRAMAVEIDEDWAADNQPVEQGGPGGSTPKPFNAPAEAAAILESMAYRTSLVGRQAARIEALETCRDALENVLSAMSPLKIAGHPICALDETLAKRVTEAVQALSTLSPARMRECEHDFEAINQWQTICRKCGCELEQEIGRVGLDAAIKGPNHA